MRCAADRSYDVVVAEGVLRTCDGTLAAAAGASRGLVVLDEAAGAFHGEALTGYLRARLPGYGIVVLRCTEQDKTIETVLRICSAAQDYGLGRREPLVAVGGGVCCDVVSVAAALVRRGVPYVTVPTTLLGQVDAGIALKGGVNFNGAKNFLGCFRPPAAVVLDPTLLRTLPASELRSGVAEMVKMAVVRDAALLAALREQGPPLVRSGFAAPAGAGVSLITRSVELMIDELAVNPYEERDLRRLVDFGHTFSGRLEEVSGHALLHGEAVAVDMAFSAAIAAVTGRLAGDHLDAILATLAAIGLPRVSPLLTVTTAREAIADTRRHRAGALNLVLPTGLGRATFLPGAEELTDDVLTRALALVRARSVNRVAS